MEEFLRSLTVFDIVVILVAMGMFVVGWFQGAIRQVLTILGFLVAFLLAANLRDQLGGFLAHNWTFYDRDFNFMLALLGLFLVFSITIQIALVLFYRRILIHPRFVWLDEFVGALLAVFEVALVMALLTVIFDSYYASNQLERADIGWARSFADLLKSSAIAGALRESFLPPLLAVLHSLLPADVANKFG